MPVNKIMVDALEKTADVAFCEIGGPAILKAEEAAQAVIDAAWTKYDPEDKDTWPDGEAYEYMCLAKGWTGRMIVGKAWQIDKWDHVIAYIKPDLILLSNI